MEPMAEEKQELDEQLPDGDEESTEAQEELEIVLDRGEASPQADAPKGFRKRVNKLNARNEKTAAERDTLAEELEHERRKNQLLQMQVEQTTARKRPSLDQYDYDQAKYDEALRAYEDDRFDRLEENIIKKVQSAIPKAEIVEDTKPLEAHYERAEKLRVSDYEAAEDAVIEALGVDVFKQVISNMRRSEQLVYFLGKNQGELQSVVAKLKENPLQGTIALGELHGQLSMRPKSKSDLAPEPEVEGGAGGMKSQTAFQKQITKLRNQGGQTKAIIALKAEARAAGFTVE